MRLMLLLLLRALDIFQPSPPIIVARDTTYITQPLRSNGLPDYEQYVFDLNRKGATHENNAAVLLWQALWPNDLDPPQYEPMRAELGMKEIPSKDDRLQRLTGKETEKHVNDWLQKQGLSPDVINADDALIWGATNRAWTSQQLPPVADWVRANKRPIDLFVEGSRRPRFYSPSPTALEHSGFLLLTDTLPGQQSVRQAARALEARAMWHIGERGPDDGWKDLLAIHRWATLTAQGPTLIEQFIAMSVSAIACDSTQALLSSNGLTDKLARQVERDVASLPNFANAIDRVDNYDRIETLDLVVYAKRAGLVKVAGVGRVVGLDWTKFVSIDWNTALRKVNRSYDRLVAAAKLPTRSTRKVALKEFKTKLTADANRADEARYIFAGLFSREPRGELIGSVIASLMLTGDAASAATDMQDRTNTNLELVRAAAALALFRTEHGTYPAKLNELIPEVLKRLPVDHYDAKPFVYRQTDDGYVLYSLGENGVDDHGSYKEWKYRGRVLEDMNEPEKKAASAKIPNGADDISIRIPCAQFEFPKATATAK